MSAEEYISLSYAGCSSNDMVDYMSLDEQDVGFQEVFPSSEVKSKSVADKTLNKIKKEKETGIMATTQLIEKRIVTVVFVGSTTPKEYAYYTDILDIKKGDCVVVATQYGPKTATISSVKGISAQARSLASKWIICRVDLDEFKGRLEKYELIAEIESEIEEEMKSQARIDYYRKAAETSPRIAELVKSLENLSSTKRISV